MLGALALAWELAGAPAGDRYALSWEAPEGCPDGERVRAELDDKLAHSPVGDAPVVRAIARVRRRADGMFELALGFGTDGSEGRRTLADRDCDELGSAAALIIALAVDPSVLDRPGTAPPAADPDAPRTLGDAVPDPDPPVTPDGPGDASNDSPDAADPVGGGDADDAPEPAPQLDPAVLSPLPAEPAERASRPRARFVGDRLATPRPGARRPGPVHAGLGVGAGAAFSVLPGAAAGIDLTAAVWGRYWRAELGATYFTPREARSLVNTAVGGVFQLWALRPRGCGLPPTAPVELQLCAGVDLGAIHGRGVGDLVAQRSMALWAAADLGAAIGWRPAVWNERVGFFVRGAVLPALTRPRFGTDPSGLVYRTPPLGGRVGVAIEVRFR